MTKRKRAAVIKAEASMATLAALPEGSTTSEEQEHIGDEFAPEEEEEGSDEFDPEPATATKTTKGKGKRASQKSDKPAPKKKKQKPAIDRKTFIKTMNKDGTMITREPQVNSTHLPLPWKGRIGYACLNTYLRSATPPIFCSRTCRIDTILKQGTPAAGKSYIESLGLANARDLSKMIRWNERYNIRFLRISSEMFPFASHPVYGYPLTFAGPALREAGALAMQYGHRLTTHPGQFTQIASPKRNVVEASVRDLEYHAELLGLLGLEGQADRDAVMILHMGGVFGDKDATLARFRTNYATLSPAVKARLVLENDDVNYTVHDLLPLCQDLSIPLVLDWHHHNIRHSPNLREGSLDLLPTLPAIAATWTNKGITQKQHYSEPRPEALTDRDMRKHSKRVYGLPPCAEDMDLMIEAKDKEQAVFELYRKFGIGPGGGVVAEVVPHVRGDEDGVEEGEVARGGSEGRVYWPEGCEHWLSPVKRGRAKKGVKDEDGDEDAAYAEGGEKPPPPKKRAARRPKVERPEPEGDGEEAEAPPPPKKKSAPRKPKPANPPPEAAPEATKPRPKRQKPPPPPTTTATEATTKKKRPTKKAPAPAPAPAPAVDADAEESDLSSPPLVSDDENEEVPSVPQQEVFLQVDREAAAAGAVVVEGARRSGRVRRAVMR
ncbi:UV-endonuclease UvdE [Morchella conica CCBAS932]|uniref:UV-endonuclease UvdE n=1 Tax=Morchella conica CCBAS932 TaxID=1392247 RepID=A0A3N4KI62_9PEZI|nr:UV-endonuclease UvdE [Morchella conica CCBAS932]